MTYKEDKFRFMFQKKHVYFISSTKVTPPTSDARNGIPDTRHTLYFSDGSGLPLTIQVNESTLPSDYFSEDWEEKKPVLQQILNDYEVNGCKQQRSK